MSKVCDTRCEKLTMPEHQGAECMYCYIKPQLGSILSKTNNQVLNVISQKLPGKQRISFRQKIWYGARPILKLIDNSWKNCHFQINDFFQPFLYHGKHFHSLVVVYEEINVFLKSRYTLTFFQIFKKLHSNNVYVTAFVKLVHKLYVS